MNLVLKNRVLAPNHITISHLHFALIYVETEGKFGHTFANSENPDETAPYEPSHKDFHCLLI